jgi:hypothetical protein
MVISGLDEGFRYVTFDIIRERVIEVKEFGACVERMAQSAKRKANDAGTRRMGDTANAFFIYSSVAMYLYNFRHFSSI